MKYAVAAIALFATACGRGPIRPASLDTKNEQCSSCRMGVSNVLFAAQIVTPSEDPRFFDDIGCLRDYLKSLRMRPPKAIAYVNDHRTRNWVAASQAVYTRVPSIDTPMGSHLIAHADAASRDQDPDARGGTPMTADDVFGHGELP